MTSTKTVKSMRASWRESRARCENPRHRQYAYYGGRGISYCERWKIFENFLADMGLRPEGMTLERRDVNGNYEPGNCVWATRKEQTNNRRMTLRLRINGEDRTLIEWSEITGIKYETLKMRVRAGYQPEAVIGKKVKFGGRLPGKVYPKRRPQRADTIVRGERCGSAKFTNEDIRRIRAEYAEGGETFSSLAKKYGVSITPISNIIKRTSYKDA